MRTWREVNGVQTGELGGKGSMSGQHGMGGRGGKREAAADGKAWRRKKMGTVASAAGEVG